MKALMKRSMALLLALILIVGFVPATIFTANAATVDYKYSGDYIYNWGTREVVATFLSPNAEAFYDENNVSYYELAALSGSATEASVPSSALYKELQSIMADAHATETSYDGTRDLFQYTDCENNGSPAEISAFYSGQAVGPAWDGGNTWNREHTWPNSKGDMAGNGENDIMMLRPASKSVNSSRGNEAYGEGTDYYDPNSVSGGEYDIRGDVARIVLYVYVRWGCTNTGSEYNTTDIFGTKGVIESKERLLEWMEEDPVDTWEMGRNDSVESITGTRNIFVDYPELAFELFEEAVPADMTTPSGMAKASAYNITAQSGNAAQGSVSVSGNVITATPNEGYEVSGYQVVSGTATVSQNGNTFTVYPTSDCTVQIDFAARTQLTVSFSGAAGIESKNVYKGETIELPNVTTAPDGYTFLGWMEAELTEDTTEKPTYYTGSYTPASSLTLYALYSYEGASDGTGSGDYVKVTEAPSDWSGEYLIVYEADSRIFNGSLDAFDVVNNYQEVTITNNTITSTEADPYKFTIAAMDGGYSIQGASGKYIGHGSNANGLTTSDSALKNTLSLDNEGNANIICAGGAYLRYNSASNQCRFRYYKSSSYTGQKAIALYRKEAAAGVLTYTGDPYHCAHANIAPIGEAVEATCTATGMTAGEKCTDCGKIITAQEVISKEPLNK